MRILNGTLDALAEVRLLFIIQIKMKVLYGFLVAFALVLAGLQLANTPSDTAESEEWPMFV